MTEVFPYPATLARVHAALKAAGLRRLVRYAGPCGDGVVLILPSPSLSPLPPASAAAAALPGCTYEPGLGVVHVWAGWGEPPSL